MARRPKITLRMVDKIGKGGCHYGHKIGDTFDFDKDRGRMCPMLLHTAFPYIDILRYGGTVPGGDTPDKCKFCCPDADVINVFEIEREVDSEN